MVKSFQAGLGSRAAQLLESKMLVEPVLPLAIGAVGAGDGCTELTGNDSAVILKTNAHSGDKGQFRSGVSTCNAAAHDVAAAQAQGSAINVGGSRDFDAIGDISPDILMEVGRRNDDVAFRKGCSAEF